MRLYIDSSVYGGYYEPEFEKPTKELFRRVRSGWFEVVYSDVVDNELSLAPLAIRRLYARYKNKAFRVVVNSQTIALAKLYVKERVLSESMLNDAVHIALATIYEIPFLVSWDKKHIVNPKKILEINRINVENDFNNLIIVTPKLLLS